MARYRRRRKTSSLGKTTRSYLVGILFVALAGFVMGVVGYITTVIPPSNITIGNVSISNTLFLNVLSFGAGIYLFMTAMRKFGIRL
jgi:UPF0716 family protein affecting phage T7 exclusion